MLYRREDCDMPPEFPAGSYDNWKLQDPYGWDEAAIPERCATCGKFTNAFYGRKSDVCLGCLHRGLG